MARRRPSLDRDWLAATTAAGLLTILFPDHRTPETLSVRRKLRLVLCGAARTVWDRLPHDDLRAAVEMAERFADGRASGVQLQEVRREVNRRLIAAQSDWRRLTDTPTAPDVVASAVARYATAAAELAQACCNRSVTVARVAGRILADFPRLTAPSVVWEADLLTNYRAVEVGPDPAAAVVRDIFGHPTLPHFADAWKSPTVVALAAGVAADAGFDRLPVLADALEDVGCEDERVLTHCRGPGPHWPGCWVVDGLTVRSPTR